MSLKVKSRKVDDVVVVDLYGRIRCGDGQLLLRETVRELIDDGTTSFVLNLSNVSSIDSAGLGELAAAKLALNECAGKANLVGLNKRVRDVLVLTKLAVEFDSFAEESKAVAALQADRRPMSATAAG